MISQLNCILYGRWIHSILPANLCLIFVVSFALLRLLINLMQSHKHIVCGFHHSLYVLCVATHERVRRLLKQHQFVKLCNDHKECARKRKFMTQLSMWLETEMFSNCSFNWKYFDKFTTFITLTPQATFFPPRLKSIKVQTWTAIELHVKHTSRSIKVAITSVLSSYHFWNYFTIFHSKQFSRHLSIINVYHDSWV